MTVSRRVPGLLCVLPAWSVAKTLQVYRPGASLQIHAYVLATLAITSPGFSVFTVRLPLRS